ncbi:hypothetical protein [Paludisphaera borealis]|uniref:Uncharacterized protein n=1 Tax=Paludisphaera borealis TaxID=1387353 RepID=A0A1U7CT53_9BACT|nr:hypothetical protein [Paludisphaera borealis]APW62130.1 hypothetical protein BSF38_03662 [Paludisphaera borealis]
MSAARRDEPEQEISIRQREHELFRSHADDSSAGPARPFADYLRDTPSAPLPAWVKALLWGLAAMVALLFAAALWRSIHKTHARAPKTPRPSVSSTPGPRPGPIAATSPRSRRPACFSSSPNQES